MNAKMPVQAYDVLVQLKPCGGFQFAQKLLLLFAQAVPVCLQFHVEERAACRAARQVRVAVMVLSRPLLGRQGGRSSKEEQQQERRAKRIVHGVVSSCVLAG